MIFGGWYWGSFANWSLRGMRQARFRFLKHGLLYEVKL